jgi:hypothetical protein
MTTAFKPGVYTMAEAEYHADPVPAGSLSASGAKKLLPPYCPAIFKWEHDNGRAEKRVFDFGHAAHSEVLGVGMDLTIIDAPDYKTKAAQEAKKDAYAAGKVPLLASEYVQVKAMAEALRRHPVAAALLDPDSGTAEASLFWTDDASGITRRARLDWLPNSVGTRMIIPDYKTAPSANPEAFTKSAANFGYHMQEAWYRDAVVALGLAEDPAFVFIVQEKTAPYLVSVVELDTTALRIGRYLNRKAIDVYAECVATDTWPGYTDDVALISLPRWYERTFEEIA